MKRLLSILTSISVLLLIGCKKGDVAGDFASQGIGSYVTKVALGNGIIDYANLGSSKVDVTVREYGTPVEKIKIYASVGAANTNTATWKFVKEVPYSGDTKLEVSATELAAALGIPPTGLQTGQTYTLYNQVISKDGQVHDISNMNSTMYGSPNYNSLMTWNAVVVCPFIATQIGAIGSTVPFVVLQDDWADWSPGTIINVTVTSATSLTIPRLWDTNPFLPTVINIAQATGAATVARAGYGDYPQYGISGITHASSGTNNWVFSCQGTITLTLNHAVGSTNYGTYIVRLRKQ
ncbi:MAG TPA: hypothetical protein VI548_02265 [Chitinophagaceae bacterium]|nr:hypothetical protein [Chitinophagaceae bacterium]